jgi:phosphatidylglycerol:prolipoprotein diacylglycerol transferase
MYLAGLLGFGGALLLGAAFALLIATPHLHNESQGKGVIGAMLGAIVGSGVYLKMRGLHFLQYADAAAPAVALGYSVYRIGCFLNGCCFGTVSDLSWAVSFGVNSEAFATQVAAGLISPDAGQTLPVHPTQFYHALLGIAVFTALLKVNASSTGVRFAGALILYGTGRFALEFFRGDAVPILGSLDADHIASLVMVVIGCALWRHLGLKISESVGSADSPALRQQR